MGTELAEDYVRLYNESFFNVPNSRTYCVEDVMEFLNDNTRNGFIIRCGNDDVGIIEIKWEEKNVYIDALAFLPNDRKKGYGTQLMRRLLDQIQKWDISGIFLIVASANHEAYRLYESMGFEWKETKSSWYETEDKKQKEESDEEDE